MTSELRAYLIELTNAETVEDLWAKHCERMADLGFDRLIYGFTRFLTANSFGDPNDLVVLSNHSAEYRKGFVEDGLYRNAPMAPAQPGTSIRADGKIIGTVTSADWGHRVGENLAMAFLDKTDAALTVDVLGQPVPAEIVPACRYDPDGSKVRS